VWSSAHDEDEGLGSSFQTLFHQKKAVSPPAHLFLKSPDVDVSRYGGNLSLESDIACPEKIIASFDGGGVRGYITALFMRRLEKIFRYILKMPDARVVQAFDLVAGTSAGAIGVACLTTPDLNDPTRPRFDMKELLKFYEGGGAAAMFQRSFWERLESGFGLLDEKYSSEPLRRALEDDYGLRAPLSSSVVPTMIVTLELLNTGPGSQPIFFKSYDESDPFRNISACDAAMCSGAAPTYFERMQVKDCDGRKRYFVDGGITGANNPSLVAYSEAWHLFSDLKKRDLQILSVGTGVAPIKVDGKRAAHWGAAKWALPIIDLSIGIPTLTTEDVMEMIFRKKHDESGGGYVRWSPRLAQEISLDNASEASLAEMKRVAKIFIAERENEFVEVAHKLAVHYREKYPQKFTQDSVGISASVSVQSTQDGQS
jgi:uncharacterized protein